MSSHIQNVIVIGGSGNIGLYIISALISKGFSVSALTRETSNSKFPCHVAVIKTDYTHPSLVKAFTGQDAIVSAIATFSTNQQNTIIDAAVDAGIKRFIPSEYGIDTQVPETGSFVPPAKPKQDTVAYLRSKEKTGLSWTGICVGAFFDWVLERPGIFGWEIPERKATIYDNGEYEFEATNVEQIGRAVAAVLLPENMEETKNRYIYVNSFTLTQKRVLARLEELTGDRFEITEGDTRRLAESGFERIENSAAPSVQGATETITAAIYGNGRLNNYSKTRGLWNERLGLPKEDLDSTLLAVLKTFEAK